MDFRMSRVSDRGLCHILLDVGKVFPGFLVFPASELCHHDVDIKL